MAHWPWSGLIADWFGPSLESPAAIADRLDWWFKADPERDAMLAERHGKLVEQCARGALYHWLDQPEGRLALVIALDQLPRNLFRGTPRAFAYDARPGEGPGWFGGTYAAGPQAYFTMLREWREAGDLDGLEVA